MTTKMKDPYFNEKEEIKMAKTVDDFKNKTHYVASQDLVTDGDFVSWCIPVVLDRDHVAKVQELEKEIERLKLELANAQRT